MDNIYGAALQKQVRRWLPCLLAALLLAQTPTKSAENPKGVDSHSSAIKLYGRVDVVVSSCAAAGITLSSQSLPAVINKVRLGSPAYYANVEEQDKVISGEITDNQISLLIERNGQRYSVRLATAPVAQTGTLKSIMQAKAALSPPLASNISTQAYRSWLNKSHPQFAASANKLDRRVVLDVEGQFDETGQTLEAFGIPYTRIGPEALADFPLDNVRVIIVNCPGRTPSAAGERVRDFVERGGYLLTTDWTLNNFLSIYFPGYVEWDHNLNRRSNYDAIAVDRDPVLFNNAVDTASWHMDPQCHLLRVENAKVSVLVRSQILSEDDFDGKGVLAVTFPFGKGKILHLVAHFGNSFGRDLPDASPQIGISLRQAIAGNFVVDGASK